MSVTGNDCATGTQVNNGNALAEAEARVAQALGVTAPDSLAAEAVKKRNADRERTRLKLRAQKAAEVCGKCGRDLDPNEGVYIACVWAGYRPFTGSYGRHYAPVCEGCAPPYMKGEGRFYSPHLDRCERRSCDTCGRLVVFRASGRERYRRHAFCCERCRWTYYNTVRNERTDQARQKVCEACGESFTAARRDARTCSPACKQKAYRQRKKGAA